MVTKRPLKLTSARILTVTLCVTLLMLAACRRQEAETQQSTQPTFTPTPRSTPLPALPTAVAPGEAGNPLQMVIHPDGDIKAAQSAAPDVEKAIKDESGLVVQIQVVERSAEALAALCSSSGGSIASAWLNGLSYTAAIAQNCGQPLMQVQRGTKSDLTSGEAVSILIKKGASISSISALKGKTFCRVGYDDLYTWLLPSVLLQANKVPALSLKAVNDYPNIGDMVKAVAAGDCDAAGIPANGLEEYADDIGDAANDVKILDTSVDFPYFILMVPAEVSLGTRITLTNTLTKLSENSTTAVKMRALLGQNALVTANTDDFSDLAKFMDSTGLNFAQLGN
jgi:ABC-type phosphate/phosphonate transport system substrate-binding protein